MLTDNEIIKALECCIDCDCTDCPCNTREGCKDIDYEAMLDLVNCQKAEITKLQGVVRRLKQYDEERDIRLHARLTEKARADATKAFAELLKTKFDKYGVDYTAYTIVDDVLKELVGEDK